MKPNHIFLLFIVSLSLYTKPTKALFQGKQQISNENGSISKLSPLGEIEALSLVKQNLTLLTEKDKSIVIYQYNPKDEMFSEIYSKPFNIIEHTCSERRYAFLESGLSNSLFLFACESDDKKAKVYYLKQIPDYEDELIELTEGLNLKQFKTDNKNRGIVRFDDKLNLIEFTVNAMFKIYSYNTKDLANDEITYVDYWGDDKI